MSDVKETFIVRLEWWEAISELSEADQACIIRNLFQYHAGHEPELTTLPVRLVWKLIEPSLARNSATYDKRIIQAKKNGALGGRPPKNQNNQIGYLVKSEKPNESLYDSVPVSVLVSDSVSVSDDFTSAKKIDTPEMILPAPGATSQQTYYETECMKHSYTMAELTLIHTAWVGARIGNMFNLKDARLNFSGYVASWRMNDRAKPRGEPARLNGVSKAETIYTEP